MQTTDSTTFNALRLRLRIGVLDPNGRVRRLYLDVVAAHLPPTSGNRQQVPPHGADLTELRGVLDERATEGDAAVVRGGTGAPGRIAGRRVGWSHGRHVLSAKTGLHHRVCASTRPSGSYGRHCDEANQLGANRPVVRGERNGRTPRFWDQSRAFSGKGKDPSSHISSFTELNLDDRRRFLQWSSVSPSPRRFRGSMEGGMRIPGSMMGSTRVASCSLESARKLVGLDLEENEV